MNTDLVGAQPTANTNKLTIMIWKETVKKLQKKYPETVFICHIDEERYRVYGRDADRVTRGTEIEWLAPFDCFTFGKNRLEGYIKKLTAQGYKATVCDSL